MYKVLAQWLRVCSLEGEVTSLNLSCNTYGYGLDGEVTGSNLVVMFKVMTPSPSFDDEFHES